MKKLFITILLILSYVLPISYLVADSPVSAADTNFGSALNKVLPATVTIIISKKLETPTLTYVETIGAGSGFIVSHDGYIITNKHVVLDTNAEYTVLLSDGSEAEGHVMYRDPSRDIAIIKIPGTYEHIASLGSSKNLKIGESVIAVGNAYGNVGHAISPGAISAMNQNITAGGAGIVETLQGLVETSTNIVPGYSGGPLVDAEGNVVGINVATDSNESNRSFSIPIDELKMSLTKYPIVIS